MEFESKIISRQIGDLLYASGLTVGTAESCTGGRIAEAIMSIPGASNYFKGGIISYTNEIKEKLLNVSHQTLEEQTAVCEDVAKQMVEGALEALNTDFAIATTGIAGPGGGSQEIPVGTIWLAWGSKDEVNTMKLSQDFGRDINLAIATNKAIRNFLGYLKEKMQSLESQNSQIDEQRPVFGRKD